MRLDKLAADGDHKKKLLQKRVRSIVEKFIAQRKHKKYTK